MNHLEIKHLRMICALEESGNMTRAAEKLCISQSALSQQLKDIENKLGTDLFFRTRKKMIITEAGKQLLDAAASVVKVVEQTELNITRKTKGEKGALKVGTQCIFCYKWLPRVLHHFHAKFPHVEVEMGNSSNLMEELKEKRYDLIITGAITPSESLTSVPLFEDQLVCILPENHPLAGCGFIKIHDFAGSTLISHADKEKNRFYQQVLKPKGIEPKRIMPIGAPPAILEMVASGFGISIFPRWALSEALTTHKIVSRPITSRGFPLIWHASYLTHKNIPIYQQEFIRGISGLNIIEKIVNPDNVPHQATARH